MNDKTPARNPDIVSRREEGEALLFDPADGNLLCVNSTGMFIWDKCDGSNTLDDLAVAVAEEYDVAKDKALEDCTAFLDKLEGPGFIGYPV